MCTHFPNLRSRLLQANEGSGGGGDSQRDDDSAFLTPCGSASNHTLLLEISAQGVRTEKSPFLLRCTIASFLIIVLCWLAGYIALAATLFDLLKPLYFVYVAGIALVDCLGPTLRKYDGWLIERATLSVASVISSVSNLSFSRSSPAAAEEAENLQSSPEETDAVEEPSWMSNLANNNTLLESSNLEEDCAAIVSQRESSHTKKSTCSRIPGPMNKNRKVKSRGRMTTGNGGTNTQLLEALERELENAAAVENNNSGQ